MGSCAAQVFSGVTQGQFDCLLQKASASGIAIAGNTGSANKDGITIAWNYDPDTQTLSIQCTSKPFFPTCGMINSEIHHLVDSCTG